MSRNVPNPLSLPETPLFGLALLGLTLLLFGVSSLTLGALGWQYGTTGGSPLEKFHPATFVAFGLMLVAAALRGNPLSTIIAAGVAYPRVVIYLLGVLGLTLHALFVAGLPATGFIDTFVLPAILLFLYRDISEGRRRNLALFIHLFFAINSLIGLAEFVGGFRLTPLIVEGEELLSEWRSSALMGHPLGNALQTGGYMILLAIGGGRDLPPVLRIPAFLLATVGMIVFGGRAATAFAVIALVWIAVVRVGEILSGGKFDLINVLFLLLMVPAVAVAIVILNDHGFFEQFVGRFVDDDGSASTRIVMFELFKHLSWYELFFRPDPHYIATLMVTYGLDYGIESFWIAMILLHGLVVSFALFAALFVYAYEMLRRVGSGGFLLMLYFFAVSSASLSLSAKTPMLALFQTLLLVLGNRAARPAPVRPAASGPPHAPIRPSRLVRPVKALSPRAG